MENFVNSFLSPFLCGYMKNYNAQYALLGMIENWKKSLDNGGYAAGLPLIAGIHLKIPIFIQDQNSIPGLITRKLQNYTKIIFSGYPISKENNKTNNYLFTGNPIRDDLKKLKKSIILTSHNKIIYNSLIDQVIDLKKHP